MAFIKKIILLARIMAAAFVAVACGCGGDADMHTVDFSGPMVLEKTQPTSTSARSLRVAVAAMISPKATFVYHRKVLDYLGSRLNKDVEIIQRKTYKEVNSLFGLELVDLAFICSGPYAIGREKYGFELLATPEVSGSHFYRSYLIVNKDSPFQRLEDLKGRVFAFTDPDSNTGRMVPVFWLAQMQQRPETFFSDTIKTHSHDNSILAVAWGLVDGAAVDGLIWEYYNLKNPKFTSRTRVIKKSEPYGIPPLVVRRSLPAELKERIRRLLFAMHEDTEGRQILKELMIDRFIMPREEWYEPIRQMAKKLALYEDTSHETQQP